MSQLPDIGTLHPRALPAQMDISMAAAYTGEKSIDAFIRKIGSHYPVPTAHIDGEPRWLTIDLSAVLRELEEQRERHGYVYFIRSGDFVKIGFARRPERRLRELQAANPNKLELVATLPVGNVTEAGAHRALSHLRHRGEWFRWCDEIAEFIRTHKDE